MHREHHKWYSPRLEHDMELLVHGHAGARVLVFPTSRGRFFEYEDRGMVANIADMIEAGHLQLYCIDSVDAESFYNWNASPGWRLWRHTLYEDLARLLIWRLPRCQYCPAPPVALWSRAGAQR